MGRRTRLRRRCRSRRAHAAVATAIQRRRRSVRRDWSFIDAGPVRTLAFDCSSSARSRARRIRIQNETQHALRTENDRAHSMALLLILHVAEELDELDDRGSDT